jgi:tetratricopeptide (TPR) repeat protein
MQPAPALSWTAEQQRWSRFHADQLPRQLARVTHFARQKRSAPDALRPYFNSYLALLDACAEDAALSGPWLEAMGALHPLPLRWGRWPAWLRVMQQAVDKSAELGCQEQRAAFLIDISAILRESGLAMDAAAAADEAYRLGLAGVGAVVVAKAAAAHAAALAGLARFEDALAIVTRAEAEVARLGTDGEVDPHVLLASTVGLERMELLRHSGRLAEAVALGEAILNAITVAGSVDVHDLAMAYRRRATILWAAGQSAAAVADLQRSAALFREAGDSLAATFSEGNLGLVYYSMAQYDQAEQVKRAAVRAAEALSAGWWLVREVGELGAIYMAQGELETALAHCRRHVELAQRYDDQAQLSLARANRGVTLMLLGRPEDARADIESSLHHYRQQGRIEGIIAATVDMALLLRLQGETRQAAQLAGENHEHARDLGIPYLQVLTARCLALFRPREQQVELLRHALSLAREQNRPLDVAGCLFSLSATVEDEAERRSLYHEATSLLDRMGARAWLNGHSMENPPLLPLFI